MDRLNVFNPFKEKELNHEDVLSRNFLILLKNLPIVQIAFVELIRESMSDNIGLPSIALGGLCISEVETQVASNNRLKGIQEHKILSIIVSDEEFENDHLVRESDRNARYDGIVICDPAWVFIIENKPSVGNVWEGQLDPNKNDANGNEVIEKPCCLSWRKIIGILNSTLEGGMVSPLEKILIEDFLDYVNETYSWLNPYNNLALCKNNKWLMDRRCGDILKEVFPNKELKYHKGWKHYVDTATEDGIVREVALDTSDDSVILWMYAGETMNSARTLYQSINTDDISKLVSEGFTIYPNFHISYQGTGLVWFTTKISRQEYIEYWKANKIEQKPHEYIKEYYDVLLKDHIVEPNDEQMTNKIFSKKYPKFNICPGLYFGYKWSLEEAKEADKAGTFVEQCKKAISTIRSAYGRAL